MLTLSVAIALVGVALLLRPDAVVARLQRWAAARAAQPGIPDHQRAEYAALVAFPAASAARRLRLAGVALVLLAVLTALMPLFPSE